MVDLQERDGGVWLAIRAQPRAKRNAVVGIHAGRLKVAVTQAADKGKANTALLKVLADALGIKSSQLRLASGATSQQKTVFIEGVTASEISRRLAGLLEENND